MKYLRRIVVSLDGEELSALNSLAEREKRNLRAQAALLIRSELERRGLLPVNVVAAQSDAARDAMRLEVVGAVRNVAA